MRNLIVALIALAPLAAAQDPFTTIDPILAGDRFTAEKLSAAEIRRIDSAKADLERAQARYDDAITSARKDHGDSFVGAPLTRSEYNYLVWTCSDQRTDVEIRGHWALVSTWETHGCEHGALLNFTTVDTSPALYYGERPLMKWATQEGAIE